jgi:ectoine hydroxylase-related dioxygenase (phytanoyl-CoA dioxygenase family)
MSDSPGSLAQAISDNSMLDPASKRLYNEKGWVKLKNLLNDKEVREIGEIISQATERPEFKPSATGARADQATEEYGRVMRVYRALWRIYPEIDALARRIGAMVGYMNNWQETRLWQDRVFIKPGSQSESGTRQTNWHQDVKLPLDRRGFATVWIAIVDIPKSRGALTFLNGSHRLGSLGAIEQLEQELDLSELLSSDDWPLVHGCESAAPLRAGDATMHSMYTLHRAGANLDEQDRVVLAISYFDGKQLYTGSPNPVTDNLGLAPNQPLNHELFPIIAGAYE